MSATVSQNTGVSIVCSTVGSGADKKKHQSSASLAFVRGIHRWQMNPPHKRSVTRRMLPFDNVIMNFYIRDMIDNSNITSIVLPTYLMYTADIN